MLFLNKIAAFSFLLASVWLLTGCTAQKQIAVKTTPMAMLQDSSLQGANVGIAVYDPSTNKYLVDFQSDHYFMPASNTKLFSLFAGLRYLGDSLPAIAYAETDTAFFLLPMGDPTFLHPDYSRQPLIDFLKKMRKPGYLLTGNWKDQAWGAGWSWDDYNDDYMVERSPLPVYGNVIRWTQEKQDTGRDDQGFAATPSIYSTPEVDWKLRFTADTGRQQFYVKRNFDENVFMVRQGVEQKVSQDVPFITHELASAVELLHDTVRNVPRVLDADKSSRIRRSLRPAARSARPDAGDMLSSTRLPADSTMLPFTMLHSQPVDSLYVPLMARSDNFFAEQILMMVSQYQLGIMNDEQIIGRLLDHDLRGLPQRPNWADGSGLSRYNLFTPRDFIWLLGQLKDEFSLDRMKRLLTTGGQGTLRNYFKEDSGHIYAKSGSLSDVVALSGYLITKKNRLLFFSVLVNSHQGKPWAIRRATESLLKGIIDNN